MRFTSRIILINDRKMTKLRKDCDLFLNQYLLNGRTTKVKFSKLFLFRVLGRDLVGLALGKVSLRL